MDGNEEQKMEQNHSYQNGFYPNNGSTMYYQPVQKPPIKKRKIVFIVLAVLLVVAAGIFAIVSFVTAQLNTDTYHLPNDEIQSISAVMDTKGANSVHSKMSNGTTTISYEYNSSAVKEELAGYVHYLREQEGFMVLEDFDLNEQSDGEINLAKDSAKSGEVVFVRIDYHLFGYTITVACGEATLTY